MIQRKTQNLAFWREDFKINEADHEFIYETLADSTEPLRLEEMAQRIIGRYCQVEESRIRNELSRGLIFDPKDSYKIGDDVVFPAFDFRLGAVSAIRPGENPEHGEFQVITVRFEDNGAEHMFAAALSTPHALNRDGNELVLSDEELLTPEALYDEVGNEVKQVVLNHLRSSSDYFINAGPLWFTTDQMVPVNVGHLNIAEAAIEVSGKPVPTIELLATADVDSDVSDTVRIFSLETAIYADDRFVQVGPRGKHAWFLRRMLPAAALAVPPALQYEPIEYDRAQLDVELLQTEWELNDELTEGGLAEEVPAQVPSTSILLLYPHLASGTLAMPPSARAIFPLGSGICTAVTLIDGRWGTRFPAWVMHEGRYVAGLADWYKQHKLPVGARITVERTNDPNEVVIDFKPQRSKRDWVRMIQIDGAQITFQIHRLQISCDYDDYITLVVPDSAAASSFGGRAGGAPVETLVKQIMPELARLSPQGTAHVKSLYSAVNAIRRMPPGPIFAALTQLPTAVDTGSGFWSM